MIFSVTRFFHCFRYTLILTRGCPESRCGESRWKWFWEDFSDFSEFSRKFALRTSEKVYEVGVRFSLEIRKRVWKWFETLRRLYSVEVPRELRWRLLKVALFGCISLKILTSLIFFSFSWGSIQFELALRSRALKPHQNFRNCPIFKG